MSGKHALDSGPPDTNCETTQSLSPVTVFRDFALVSGDIVKSSMVSVILSYHVKPCLVDAKVHGARLG